MSECQGNGQRQMSKPPRLLVANEEILQQLEAPESQPEVNEDAISTTDEENHFNEASPVEEDTFLNDILNLANGNDSDSSDSDKDEPKPKRSRATCVPKKGSKTAIWKEFVTLYDTKGKVKSNSCKHCNEEVSAKACRMKKHVLKCTNQPVISSVSSLPRAGSSSRLEDFPTTSEIKSRMKIWKDDAVKKSSSKMDEMIGKMIFSANLPFSFASNPFLQSIVDKAGIPNYKVPNPQKIGGPILDQTYAECEDTNRERFNGKKVVISQDGWSTNQNAPVICHSIQVGKESLMFDAISTTVNKKDAEYCQRLLSAAIDKAEDLFGCTVVGVVTDNCNVMKKMRNSMPKGIHTYGCVAHILNLLGQDMTNSDLISKIVYVQKFFRNHHFESASLQEKKANRPVLPGKTRWNSQLDTLDSYIKNHLHYLSIARDKNSSASKNKDILEVLNDGNIYADAERLLNKLRPIALALDQCQSDTCTLAKAVDIWLSMVSKLPFEDQNKDITLGKERLVLTDIAIGAYMVHPVYRGEKLTRAHEATGFAFLENLHFQLPVITSGLKALDENIFPRHLVDIKNMNLMSPVSWWRSVGAYSSSVPPKVVEVCENLLVLSSSTAVLERAFSTMGNIITKKRNRLGIEKARKLAVVNKTLGFSVHDDEDSE